MESYSGQGPASNGSVYVCNLPDGTDENMLAEYFGTIGLLKKDKRTGRPKIWLYRDKVTNEPKRDASATYEDPHAAFAAVEWFNNKDFHGNIIGGRGRGDASGKTWQQEGDWQCPNTSGGPTGGRFGPTDWSCPISNVYCFLCNDDDFFNLWPRGGDTDRDR
ncbi:hypothetical protein UlMin_008607 [Ulmus minor]